MMRRICCVLYACLVGFSLSIFSQGGQSRTELERATAFFRNAPPSFLTQLQCYSAIPKAVKPLNRQLHSLTYDAVMGDVLWCAHKFLIDSWRPSDEFVRSHALLFRASRDTGGADCVFLSYKIKATHFLLALTGGTYGHIYLFVRSRRVAEASKSTTSSEVSALAGPYIAAKELAKLSHKTAMKEKSGFVSMSTRSAPESSPPALECYRWKDEMCIEIWPQPFLEGGNIAAVIPRDQWFENAIKREMIRRHIRKTRRK